MLCCVDIYLTGSPTWEIAIFVQKFISSPKWIVTGYRMEQYLYHKRVQEQEGENWLLMKRKPGERGRL